MQKDLLLGVRFGVAAQDQGAPVGGREMHVEHLDRSKLVEHRARGESRGQRFQSCAQRHVQTIGHEGDEDMRLDAALELVVNRTQLEIIFQVLERRLDLGELDVELPQLGGLAPTQVGTQQIAALAPAHLAQFLAIQVKGEVRR